MNSTEQTTAPTYVAPTYVAFGDHDLDYGYRIDGSKVMFWGTKARAVAGAKAVGWPVRDLTKVHTRFQCGWALSDGFGLLSKDSYISLHRERNT